ncbi:glutathione synthase [Limnobacter humi]|uniref:Glutathione synthetase n=1 Tax=Limnobacter humi TaxID=1778671 RepID=A0ABT1WD88_9BURK|nr:glutathione synthase [Limnobacter humi]MCQ8895481.1 glutathione synthase [Limnobacter humi]
MSLKTFVCVIDPLTSLNPKKDSSIAMMEAAQARGWRIGVIEDGALWWKHGECVRATVSWIAMDRSQKPWYTVQSTSTVALKELTAVVMRKDPPFDAEFVTSTWLLEQAEREGARVFNKPSAIRDHNEKFTIAQFSQFVVPTLVSRNADQLRGFLEEHPDAIAKPLDGMGGSSIFRMTKGDPNTGVILETLTEHGRKTAMIQRYIPEIVDGDKRVLLIDGEPVPYCLARLPKEGEHRGNLAAGGTGRAQPLSDTDRQIAETLGPILKDRGLLLVGLDVIGRNLTEVNVTSPTCFREIMDQTGFNVAEMFVQAIERKLEVAPC